MSTTQTIYRRWKFSV